MSFYWLVKRFHFGAKNLCQADGVSASRCHLFYFSIWQQVYPNKLSSFHADLQVFSNRFSQNGLTCFPEGRLSSLAVHNGISLRKSDEEEECVLEGFNESSQFAE